MDERDTGTRQLMAEVTQLEQQDKLEEACERLRQWAEEVPVSADVRHHLIRLCLASGHPGALKVAARQVSLVLLERRLA